jgi:hypothetical protein
VTSPRSVAVASAAGLALVALALSLYSSARSSDPVSPPPSDHDIAAGTGLPSADIGPSPAPSPVAPSPAIGIDLATKLASALDAGARAAPTASDAPVPSAGAPSPPRPLVRLGWPLSASEQLEYVARLHDFILVRREDLQHQLEQARAAGDTLAIRRLEAELVRLDANEPVIGQRVDSLAARVRDGEGARRAPAQPPP